MKLFELQEAIEELLAAKPEAGDMRVCFFDSASQLSHSLWEPEIGYLDIDSDNGSESLYPSVEDLEIDDLTTGDVEAIITL